MDTIVRVSPVDYRSRKTPVDNLVVFSRPPHAPTVTEQLQLGTPAYYRNQERLEAGIRDRHDGTITKDGGGWIRSVLAQRFGVRFKDIRAEAEMTFETRPEPWLYCAAHYRDEWELRKLGREFAVRYGYTAATRIEDADAFARALGRDFAQMLNPDSPLDEIVERDAPLYGLRYLQAYVAQHRGIVPVEVFHGPVHYADVAGSIDTQAQMAQDGVQSWFVKRTRFKTQSEYRFAVCAIAPSQELHRVPVSLELRALTSPL